MKKLFYAGLAFSMALLFVSCSEDLGNQVVEDTLAEVTFAVDIESAASTRAISDGTGADQLMWAIFNDKGELIVKKSVIDDADALLSTQGYSFTTSLAMGVTYKAVFWAQNTECTAYTVSDDMKVTVDYTGVNNDESRDAFFASSEAFTLKASTTISVVLKRPFAQVNVGAYPLDTEIAEQAGLEIMTSSATIKAVPDCINLFDGSLDGAVDVEYSSSAIPQEGLNVDIDKDGQPETYDWLSMSYILAPKDGGQYEMSFTFAGENGENSFEFGDGLGAIHAKRNWRTNIVGQFLTGDMQYDICIDPSYEGESVNARGIYYNFMEDTVIEDKTFAFNTLYAATFTSENNNLLTFNDVVFSGKVQYIAFGEYRDKGSYLDFRNELNNVVAKDMVATHSVGIVNVETIDYMSPLIFLRGESTLNGCTLTGATCTAPDKTDYNGKTHKVLPYDCGVPNFCTATFNSCKVDRIYAWSHSRITINDSEIGYIRCSTHKKANKASHLTIGSGTVVDEIVVTSSGAARFATIDGVKTLTATPWSPSIIIKAGAKVNRLDYNGRTAEDVIIEEGAIIGEVVNLAE